MNEARAPTDEKLKGEILKEYRKGIKPKALSEKFGISVNTIKSWIKRNKFKIDKPVEDAPRKKKGAPIKNKNAEGHGAPARNKNAEKHGAYSSIYWDSLECDELELLEVIDYNEEYQLERQIDLYTIRERRLMARIKAYKESGSKQGGLLIKGITKEQGAEKGSITDLVKTEMEAVMNTILLLEKELTSIQSKKTKAIEALSKFHIEKEKISVENKDIDNDVLRLWTDKVRIMRSKYD